MFTEEAPKELRPFEPVAVQPAALESMERASIDIQVATAKKYPRPSMAVIRQRIMECATADAKTAASCFYTLKREGKPIAGPSVRLAEIALSCYTNVRVVSRIVENDGRTLTAQAICHDMEANVAVGVEVKRRITRRDGSSYSEDMQAVAANAAASIAMRNAVFKIIPGVIIGPVFDRVKQVAAGEEMPISVRREKALQYFQTQHGVQPGRVLAFLGRQTAEEITGEDITALLGVSTALAEGATTVNETFPAERKKAAFRTAPADVHIAPVEIPAEEPEAK